MNAAAASIADLLEIDEAASAKPPAQTEKPQRKRGAAKKGLKQYEHTPETDHNPRRAHHMTVEQRKAAVQTFDKAVEAQYDGSYSELAREIGVSPQAVVAWRRRGVFPVQRVPAIAKLLDGVTREDLRPDIYA